MTDKQDAAGVGVSMIVAMASNRVIGNNNQLPWYLPNDLKYFKQVTMGKPIIMGRKTFQSIGRPLPGRTNIVVTRDRQFDAPGVRVVHSVAEAMALADSIALLDGSEEVMVIGGAELYQSMLPLARRLYITHVEAEIAGDAWFPQLDWQQWRQCACEHFAAEGPNPYPYSMAVYERNPESGINTEKP